MVTPDSTERLGSAQSSDQTPIDCHPVPQNDLLRHRSVWKLPSKTSIPDGVPDLSVDRL